MWKVFLAFVKKEIYHIVRDKRTLLILFGMPIAQVLIFGYAVTNEFNNTQIQVLDHAQDETSQQLVQHIQSSGNFLVKDMLSSERQMEEGFKDGSSKLVLVIPEQFTSDFYSGKTTNVQLITDGSDPNNANTLVQYMTAMLSQFRGDQDIRGTNPYRVNIEMRMFYNPQLESAYNFIPGTIALILLIISAMMTSLTIAKEKETGTMEVLLVSPLSPWLIILGKVTPYAALSFIDAVLVLVLGFFVFNVPILGSLTLLLLLCFLYVLTALSLGTLISTVSSTQQDAMLRSLMGLMMPSMLLSGFIFPIASMPVVLQVISNIIPATYFIEILKGVMLRGVSFPLVATQVFVLLFMTAFFLIATWRKFNIRLE
ncbi:MAG: ABC transporter permease [Balneola sp.]